MELQPLLIQFAQRNSMKYEFVLQKANRFIEGGWNEFVGFGIVVDGGTVQERQENLRKELEKVLS